MDLIGKRYEIKRKIGSGSLGDVFLARDRRDGINICLKLLHQADQAKLDRLRREFKLLTQLEHPNLTRVFDFGVDDTAGPYFTMEYAFGGDLGKVSGLDPDGFRKAASSICAALDFIHTHGIIHGDLKPSNILIDADGNYRLSDFGLSFVRGRDEKPQSSGSIAYAAPEVLRSGSLSPTSDIYSLGLIFYEMILGTPLFAGDTAVIIGHKLSGATVGLAVSAEYGGGKMAAVLSKMTAPDPAYRYQSVHAVVEDLDSLPWEIPAEKVDSTPLPGKAPFVGREEELGWLRAGLETWKGGRNVLLYIQGEPGFGKSRLLDEFRIGVQTEGLRFYRVHCREGDLRPLSPLIKLTEQASGELDPDFTRSASYGPDLRQLLADRFLSSEPSPKELTEADIRAGRRRLFDNLFRYLEDMSRSGQAIFALEDIHWADGDTLDFLRFAGDDREASDNLSLFVVCTGEKGAEDPSISFLLREADHFRVLSSVGGDVWNRFLRTFLGQEELPSGFSAGLKEETGGNFLFAEEILKELAETGAMTRHRGTWTIRDDWRDGIGVPESVRDLIGRRIRRLSPELETLAGFAAVLGESFLSEEILELAQVDVAKRYLLDQLVDAGILSHLTFSRQQRLDIAHGQLRRTIYDQLPDDQRRRMHAMIAAYFEKRGAGPELLGHHYLFSGDYDNGHRNLLEAAKKAERIYAYRKAADFYLSALKCMERLQDIAQKEQLLFRVNLARGKALDFVSPVEAAEQLANAVRLAESMGLKSVELAEATLAAGANCIHIGDNEKAVRYLEEALSSAQVAGDARLEGEAYTVLGFAFDKMGRLDEAEKSYLNALDVFAGIDYPEGSCRVLSYLGIISKRRGDFDGAQDFYRRALEISVERKFLWSAMNLYGNLGNLHSSRDDHRGALECYTRSLEISREISDRRIESINLLNIGHALNEMGKLEDAERRFLEAIDRFRELGDKGSEAITLNNLALLYFRKGAIVNSIENYEKGLDIAREIHQPRIELANRIGLAEDLAAIADFDKAIEMASGAKKLAEEMNDAEQLAAVLSIMAGVMFEIGNLSQAREMVRQLLLLPGRIGTPLQRAMAVMVGMACNVEGASEQEITELLEKDPRVSPAVTRFRAAAALKEQRVPNPELWVARLDDAIRKSKAHFLTSETWRLSVLKLKYLQLLGERLEITRQVEKMNSEISRALVGVEHERIENLLRFLEAFSDNTENGAMDMGTVSREERLEVLIRVARTVNTIRQLDPLLNKIMDLALETLNGERGFIMLYSDSKAASGSEKALEPVVARNLDREDILSETTISHSSALEVARSGKPLLLGSSDAGVEARQSVVDFRISSVLCAPLAVKGEVLGIVYVDSRSGVTFSQDDLEFLVSFADLAAIAIENARLTERLAKKNIYLQKQVESTWGFGNIVGRSAPMLRVFRMAESVAETDVTVVITGESGTGKELLARAIHVASARKSGRFVPVDCGAVAESLLESELFGYVKGAFTGAASDREGLFEVAEGGTVFLDEISNTSKGFQAKLLRILQENEIRRVGDNKTRRVDVRVIAATNKDLEKEVTAGNFREDLYYRINVVSIGLPPLRERPDDIPLLANHFLGKIANKMKAPVKTFSREAIDCLLICSWPGNVRQLENICERAVIFTKGETIDLKDLPVEIRSVRKGEAGMRDSRMAPKTKSELKAEKERIDRIFLLQVLEMTGGNVMEASRVSGMDRSQIHHMMSRFGLNSADFKKRE